VAKIVMVLAAVREVHVEMEPTAEEQALPVDAREMPSVDFEGPEDLFSGRGCTWPSRISGSTMPRT
jgi:hypothetical protein